MPTPRPLDRTRPRRQGFGFGERARSTGEKAAVPEAAFVPGIKESSGTEPVQIGGPFLPEG